MASVSLRPQDVIAIVIIAATSTLLYFGRIDMSLYSWCLGCIMGYYFREAVEFVYTKVQRLMGVRG